MDPLYGSAFDAIEVPSHDGSDTEVELDEEDLRHPRASARPGPCAYELLCVRFAIN